MSDLSRQSRVIAGAFLIALTLGSPIAATPARVEENPPKNAAGFAIAATPFRFNFPRDHAAHPGYQTEWWYYTGHLRTSAGRRFGYELTFFRIGLRPDDPAPGAHESRWRGHELYAAHFAITDEAGRTFFHTDRFTREALEMGRASRSALAVRVGTWSLDGAPSGPAWRERMLLHALADSSEGRNAIDLTELPEKPPAIHGHGGVSRKGSCASCASHYYSYTRLRTTGSILFHGTRYAVDGLSWMDHEFGSGQLEPGQVGWDWFAIQLDDRRELMLYALRERDGSISPQSSGSVVSVDGHIRYLPRDAFTIEPKASWTSPHTGGRYPAAWSVRIPSVGLDLTITPVVADQELAGDATGVAYWEGAVEITDSERRRIGVGYVELTGYAGAVRL